MRPPLGGGRMWLIKRIVSKQNFRIFISMFSLFLVIIGLVVFEIVNSIDNAVVNAHILKVVSPKARRWFFLWGMVTAVLLVRGALPFLLLWFSSPGIPLREMFLALVGLNPDLQAVLQTNAYVLLLGGGMFLIL